MAHDRSFFNRVGPAAVKLFGAAFLVAASNAAVAQDAGDTAAGHRLAETWCGNCHVVGSEQKQGTSNGAPPFAAIADMKSTTELGLHAFLQTPHDRMPDLHLSRNETDDVVSYIISLRRQHRP
jgi:mono/diheme cytochrome c family protein